MPSESELAQRLARLRFLGMTQAKTGHPDGRLNAGTNQTWIQTDNERAPTAVYGTVGARNVPVWTREMPDGSRVLDKPDYIIGGVTYGGALETVSQPQLQPVDRGNPVVIPSQNMDAGRVIPSPDGSLYVRITPYHYPGGYWNGFENILVEPPAGTLNHRIALVGLDYQSAAGTAVGVVSYGQAYATPIPLTHEEAARMAIGTQSVDWRGWLGLTGGQGSVMGSLVYDARWFSPGIFQGTDGTLTSYAGLVPTAAGADASKFLRGDGDWATPTSSGGGGSTEAAAYASLTTGSDGDLRFPTDGFHVFRSNGSALIPWGPLFPLTLPSFSGAWTNQGSATLTVEKGSIVLTTPGNNSGNALRVYTKAAPSTPYTITVAFIPFLLTVAGASGSIGCGILFRQSSDGKLATLELEAANSATDGSVYRFVGARKWTDAATFSATYVTSIVVALSLNGVIFMRIADNGTNRICSLSNDGQIWKVLHTVGRTDFLTADEIGFFLRADGATTNDSTMRIISYEES